MEALFNKAASTPANAEYTCIPLVCQAASAFLENYALERGGFVSQIVVYDVKSAAATAHVSVSLIRKKIRFGELEVTRIGRRVLIRAAALEELLKAGEQKAA
jgi:excisionase family DNA binding protein